MAKTRMVNTKFWSDSFISELNPLDRYLFLYFLTNEHTNISGIYELPLKSIAFETGIEIDMLKKMINRLAGKIHYINGWVCILNFPKHQARGHASIKKGIELGLKSVPEDVLKEAEDLGYGSEGGARGVALGNLNLNLNSNINLNINSNTTSDEVEVEPHTESSGQTEVSFSKEIAEVIFAFKEVNPAYQKWYGRKPMREACARLLVANGKEKLLKMIATLPQSNVKEYFPMITTPIQLEDKMAQLANAWQKFKTTNTSKGRGLII